MKSIGQSTLHKAGIKVFENAGVFHFRVSDEVLEGANRFSSLQSATASSAHSPKISFLATLDLMSPDVLLDLLDKPLFKHRVDGHTYLELSTANSAPWRLSISDFTSLTIPRELSISDQDIKDLCHWITSQDGYGDIKEAKALEVLRLDQLRWAFLNLPPAVFSNYCGFIHVVRLPLELLALKDTPLVPLQRQDEEPFFSPVVGTLLDSVDQDRLSGHDPGNTLISLALETLKTSQWLTHTQHINQWLSDLTRLAPRFRNAQNGTIIVFCWMYDLIESGTTKKGDDAHHLTRRKYAVAIAKELHEAIKTLPEHPSDWSDKERRVVFQELISSITPSDRHIAIASVATFQRFLDELFDLDPVFYLRAEDQPVTRIRAQFVPEQCLKRSLAWVDQATMEDTLLKLHISTVLAMGHAAPFRLNEMLYLRFVNIHERSDGTFDIEISSRPGKRQLKTINAGRRVHIQTAEACSRLRGLMTFRKSHLATSSELLFSHPSIPNKVHRRHFLVRQLLLILKATTGDEDMTFHALRHTWACDHLVEHFSDSLSGEATHIAEIAVAMGHSSITTTFNHYFHFQDELLRLCLDFALRGRLHITSQTTESFTGISANTLRQRSKRSGLPLQRVCGDALRLSAAATAVVDIPSERNFVPPTPPKITGKSLFTFTPRVVLNALHLVSQNLDETVIAHQLGISDELFRTINESFSLYSVQMAQGTLRNAELHLAAKFVMRAAFQSKYAHVIKYLDTGEISPAITDGLKAWRHIRNRYGYLDLTDPLQTQKLMLMLRSIGVFPANLIIKVQDYKSSNSKVAVANISSVFRHVFAESPKVIKVESVSTRRPVVYLTWVDHQKSQEATSAGSSMRGLDAILMSLLIFSIIEVQHA